MKETIKVVEKTWGCEVWWTDTDKYMGKTLIINPGKSTSLHYHEHKDETILVIRGKLTVYDDRGFPWCAEIYPGNTIRILPKERHKLSAGEHGVELIEFSTPHPDDSVRVKI